MSERTPAPRLTDAQRVVGIIVTVIMAIVMVSTVLIVAPAGTPLRSEVRSVATPYFGQNWRVFAPNILKVDRTLEVRVQWRDDEGALVRSGWVDLTKLEQRTVEGNLLPSRTQKLTWNASNTYLNRYFDLDPEQRVRVRDTFIEAHDGGFRPIPVEDLIAELGEGESDVIRFLRMDYMFMRNATLYGTAGFNKTIERVQWRVVRERPNDFTHRFDDDSQFSPTVTTFGWRESNLQIDPDVVADYRSLIVRAGGTYAFEEAAREAE